MRLPAELLLNITKHLDMIEILKFRLLCKEWRCFIDEFCLDELILFISVYPTLELWKSNSKPIDFKRMLFLTSDRCLSDEGFKYTFRNVRKLFLTIRNEQEASYKIEFSRLQHLEITRHNSTFQNHSYLDAKYSPHIGGRMKCVAGFELNLNSLKTLHVNTLCDRIVLNCPNLSELSFHLVYPSFSRPTHYQQIRKLTCFYSHPFIKGLENLESLVCHSYYEENEDDPHLLKYFPKLKFLYFYAFHPLNEPGLEEEIVRLKRDDLGVYYFGKMGRWRKNFRARFLNFSVFDCGNMNSYYYGDDLAKLAPTLPTPTTLYYDLTFRGYDRRFYERLINVQALNIVQGPTTQAEIVELIDCFKSIVILLVSEGEHLDQNFYDVLPDHYPHLRVIHIDNRRLDKLDLHFLFRLNHLYSTRFEHLESIQTRPDYKNLVEKLRKKKSEITSINGDLLFQIDRFKFKLEPKKMIWLNDTMNIIRKVLEEND